MNDRTTRGWAERIARHGSTNGKLFFEESTVDAATLSRVVRKAGEELLEIGIEAGDLVAVLAPPSVAGVVLIKLFQRPQLVTAKRNHVQLPREDLLRLRW